MGLQPDNTHARTSPSATRRPRRKRKSKAEKGRQTGNNNITHNEKSSGNMGSFALRRGVGVVPIGKGTATSRAHVSSTSPHRNRTRQSALNVVEWLYRQTRRAGFAVYRIVHLFQADNDKRCQTRAHSIKNMASQERYHSNSLTAPNSRMQHMCGRMDAHVAMS